MPLVFQCNKCNEIVADSTNFVSSDSALQWIVVSECSGGSRGSAASPEGIAAVTCDKCKSVIGCALGLSTKAQELSNGASNGGRLPEKDIRTALYVSAIKAYEIGAPQKALMLADIKAVQELNPVPSVAARRIAMLESIVVSLQSQVDDLRQAMEQRAR